MAGVRPRCSASSGSWSSTCSPFPAPRRARTAPRRSTSPGPGGNALNVAVAAGPARRPRSSLLARLGTGPLAGHLRRHAELSGVDVAGFVQADRAGEPRGRRPGPRRLAVYGFHVLGAADWQWTDEELAAVLPASTGILHVGLDLELDGAGLGGDRPAGRAGARRRRAGQRRPEHPARRWPTGRSGRPSATPPGVVRDRLDRLVARADVVKVSAEDLEWLEPGGGRYRRRPRRRGAALGRPRRPALVLLTDGGAPLRVARPGRPLLHREPPRVPVVDTVGAGDSLAAGLLGGLLDRGRHHPRRAGGPARRAPARAWSTTPPWSPRSTAPGSAPTRRRGPSSTPPGRPGDARRRWSALVGFAELSATTAAAARLLEAHDRFWDSDTRALHDPVFFHQFGGLRRLALTAGRTSATCWAW